MKRPVAIVCLVTALLGASSWVWARSQKPTAKADRHFDHAAHEKKVKSGGKPPIACEGACHASNPAGTWVHEKKREHARCFESCHTFETNCSKLQEGPGAVCITCHENLKASCVPGGQKPQGSLGDAFRAIYSHKKHIQPSAKTGRQCEGCHGEFGNDTPKRREQMGVGHSLCASCHEKAVEPAMTECVSCHESANLAPSPLKSAPNPYAALIFDHRAHAKEKRVGTQGRDCLVCHSNIAQAENDTAVPMPTMQGCYQSCHNGKQAFSVVTNTCTRCHRPMGAADGMKEAAR